MAYDPALIESLRTALVRALETVPGVDGNVDVTVSNAALGNRMITVVVPPDGTSTGN